MRPPVLVRRWSVQASAAGNGQSLATSAAMAASATAMSCSTVPALAPTAPTMLPFNLTGMPPPKMTTLPTLVSWMPKGKRQVLTHEGQQMTPGIDDGDIVCDSEALGLHLGHANMRSASSSVRVV